MSLIQITKKDSAEMNTDAIVLWDSHEIGEVKIKPDNDFAEKFIISTYGPIYQNGRCGEMDLLANCYRESLKLAEKNKAKSICFSCIPEKYGYPIKEAAEIALKTIYLYFDENPSSCITGIVVLATSSKDEFDFYVAVHAKTRR